MKTNLIVVLGPTATGKTHLAARLAHRLDGEIISADSRQVYRRMDLGTGKDYQDYEVRDQQIPYHLIDICEPGEKYDVHRFQQDFCTAFQDIQQRGKQPILCGGTGMYLEAVTRGYALPTVHTNYELRAHLQDKTMEELQAILSQYRPLHNRSDADTRERALRAIEIEVYKQEHPSEQSMGLNLSPTFLGLQLTPEIGRQRIAERLQQRLEAGMVEEVRGLLQDGLAPEDLVYYGLEYKFLTQYVTGRLDFQTMKERLYVAICQFAKRQRTWFRRMERNGAEIHWINAQLDKENQVQQALNRIQSCT